MRAIEEIRASLAALYALAVYLPVSRLARVLRRLSRALRGKTPSAVTRLPQASWSELLPARWIRLTELDRHYGNVNLSELAILAQAATRAETDSEIIEIGTFDGRTSLNLAVNAPAHARVVTLDLPANHATAYRIEAAERALVQKPASGGRLRSCRPVWRDYADRVLQVFGDSATYEWPPHLGRASLVFVDGSHAYEYARKDSETALGLVRPRGTVIWHDYGVWPGVTRALEELEAARKLGLRHIRGTSLVLWRAPDVPNPVQDVSTGHQQADDLHLAAIETVAEHGRLPVPGR
jgi:hypothetical protein